MRKPTLLLALLWLTGCAKSVWPSDVVPGAVVSVGWGDGGISRAEVVRIDGDWLVVRKGATETRIAREKVIAIRVEPSPAQ